MYVEGIIDLLSRNKFYRASVIINELMWVFVALIIQHAKRMFRILLSSINYQNVPYFFTIYYIFFNLCHKCQDFVKRVIEH